MKNTDVIKLFLNATEGVWNKQKFENSTYNASNYHVPTFSYIISGKVGRAEANFHVPTFSYIISGRVGRVEDESDAANDRKK